MPSELRKLRLGKGSLTKAERATGIPKGSLSKYERGLVRNPRYENVIRLAEYLEVTPSRLIQLLEKASKSGQQLGEGA